MELISKEEALESLDNYKTKIKNEVFSHVALAAIDMCKRVIDSAPSAVETDDSTNVTYISCAITGTSDYMARFETAENYLKSLGYRVINPAKINANMPENTGYEDYMKISMCLLDMCDSIYMLKGWKKSCGANREYGYAFGKGMIIIEE